MFITFQPVATFTGTVTKPVNVRIADANGTTVTTTYTPTVTDVTMTAENATSEDVKVKHKLEHQNLKHQIISNDCNTSVD